MSTPDTTYNGWTNYETWLVSLWWDEDPFLANQRRPEMVADAKREAREWRSKDDGTLLLSREQATRQYLEGTIREYVTDPDNDLLPDLGASMAADLLSSALSKVNWREIATNWLEDVP